MSLEGKLVSFEGIDGCGKGTQLDLLHAALDKQNVPYHQFREPGGTTVGEQIRNILLHPETDIDDVTELFLFQASRADLANHETRLRLAQGRLVLLDRYYDSTMAYQGAGRFRNDPDILRRLDAMHEFFPTPNKTFYFQISVAESKRRLASQGASLDRMEQQETDFHFRVKTAYDTLAEKNSERFVTIDGTLDPQEIHEDYVMPVIDGLYHARTRSSSD